MAKSAGSREEQFRPDIEGLRGIAVALVVIYHAGLLSASNLQLGGGFIGVDLFFVISGFLITGLLIRERERSGKTSFSRFYARRVRRILPAAAVTLLVTIPAAYSLVTVLDRPSTMQDGATAALSIANIRFALSVDYFNPTGAAYSPFLHFWSLGVEEQFYFIWPPLLALVAWRRTRLAAAIALSAIVVASFIASVVITADQPSWAFYMLPTRAWQLGAGGLLAVLTGVLPRLPKLLDASWSAILGVAGWIGLGLLFLASMILDGGTPYPGTAAILPTVAGVALIASGGLQFGPGALLRLWPLRFLGRISYSLYLWHWPLLILGSLYLNGPLGQLNTGQAFGLALLAIPVATLSWALVEEPFRRGRVPLPRPSRVVAVGVFVMALVAALGTSFSWSAQTALAGIGGGPIAADETEAPDPTDPPLVPTPSPSPLPPGATPAPTPAMTPALRPTPNPAGSGFALNAATRPSLANAAADKEKNWFDNCLAWERVVVPRTDCIYGNRNGKFTVALIGDSHASALFPAVNAVAKAHGWKLIPYLKINCTFADFRVDNFILKRSYPECSTWNANLVARLQSNPVDLVLVSNSRWIFPSDAVNGTVTAQGQGIGREIAKIPSQTRVAIIDDIPLPGYDIPKCLSAHVDDYRACAYSRAAGFSGMGAREKIAAAATGASRIDLSASVCPGSGACPAVVGNMITFRDEHHLTATFAVTLGPALDAKLVGILQRPGP